MAPSDPPTTRKASEAVTHGQLTSEFNKQNINLATQIANQIAAQTLTITDTITKLFDSRIVDCEEKVRSVTFDLAEFKDSTVSEINKLKSEVYLLKMNSVYHMCRNNVMDQRNRKQSLRVHFFKTDFKSSPDVMKDIWTRLFSPALDRAFKDNDIDFMPCQAQVIEHGHILRREDSTVPPITVALTSRYYMYAVLKHVRIVIDSMNVHVVEALSPAEGDPPEAGPTPSLPSAKRLRVSRDMTAANRSVMTRMYSDKEVIDKVKLVGENIMFTFKDSPTHWRTVHNPFAATYADMQIAPVSPEQQPLNPLLE